MSNFMPTLPYAPDALEPVISKDTIDFHYGKHLQTYANNLEKLTRGTALENRSIEEIVVDAPEGAVYNNVVSVAYTAFSSSVSASKERTPPAAVG